MTKWGVLIVVAAMMIAIFATFGAQMSGFIEAPYALKINGEEIPYETVDRIVQDREQHAGIMTDTTQRDIYRTVIDDIIYEKLAMQEAAKMGFSATDREIVEQEQARLFRDDNGNFNRGKFEQARRTMSSSQWLQYEKMIGDDITMQKILHAMTSAVVVTPGELDDFYNLRYQRAGLRHILIRPGDFVPESVARAFYDANTDSFMIPERVKGRHILFRIPQNASQDLITAAKARAEVALLKLQSGASFDKLYAEAKADTMSRGAVLAEELDWFQRGQMVPEFETVAFAWPVGMPTRIIQTQFGFHIALFSAHELPHVEPFADLSERIRARLSGESEIQEARVRAEEILKRLKAGESFEALAKQYSSGKSGADGGWLGDVIPGEMTPELYPDSGSLERIGKEVGNIGQGGQIILDPAIAKTLFDQEVGKISDVVMSGHGFHIVRIERRRGGDPAMKEKLRPSLEREYRDDLKRQLFRDWTVALRAKAKIEYGAIVKSKLAS